MTVRRHFTRMVLFSFVLPSMASIEQERQIDMRTREKREPEGQGEEVTSTGLYHT